MREPNVVDPMDSIIDSRNVIARINWIESELATHNEEPEEGEEPGEPYLTKEDVEDYTEELTSLRGLAQEGEGHASDWANGVGVIANSYFEDYAKELASDLHGGSFDGAPWPFNHIDWESAVTDIQTDYSRFDWEGYTFWVHN